MPVLEMVNESCLACFVVSPQAKELVLFQITDSCMSSQTLSISKNTFYQSLFRGVFNYRWRRSKLQVSVDCPDQVDLVSAFQHK